MVKTFDPKQVEVSGEVDGKRVVLPIVDKIRYVKSEHVRKGVRIHRSIEAFVNGELDHAARHDRCLRQVLARAHGLKDSGGILVSKYGARRPRGSKCRAARDAYRKKKGITYLLAQTIADIHVETYAQLEKTYRNFDPSTAHDDQVDALRYVLDAPGFVHKSVGAVESEVLQAAEERHALIEHVGDLMTGPQQASGESEEDFKTRALAAVGSGETIASIRESIREIEAQCEERPATVFVDLPPPYPWCMSPDKCRKLGHCPRNPSCGD